MPSVVSRNRPIPPPGPQFHRRSRQYPGGALRRRLIPLLHLPAEYPANLGATHSRLQTFRFTTPLPLHSQEGRAAPRACSKRCRPRPAPARNRSARSSHTDQPDRAVLRSGARQAVVLEPPGATRRGNPANPGAQPRTNFRRIATASWLGAHAPSFRAACRRGSATRAGWLHRGCPAWTSRERFRNAAVAAEYSAVPGRTQRSGTISTAEFRERRSQPRASRARIETGAMSSNSCPARCARNRDPVLPESVNTNRQIPRGLKVPAVWVNRLRMTMIGED